MSIFYKLIIGFVSVATFVVLLGFFAWITIEEIEGDFDEVKNDMLPVVEILEEFQIRGLQVMLSAFDFGLIVSEVRSDVTLSEEKKKHEIAEELKESYVESYRTTLAKLERITQRSAPEYDAFMADIKPKGEKLLELSAEFIRLKNDGLQGEAALEWEERIEEQGRLFLKTVDQVVEHEKEEAEELHDELHEKIQKAIRIFMLTGGITFLLAVLLGAFISQRITAPLIHLTKATGEIAKTKFDHRVNITTNDEVGELAESFNQMVEDLSRTTVSKVYYENIVNSMNNSLIVLDAQGMIKEVNQTTNYLLGYKDGELTGQSIELIIDKKSIEEGDSTEFLSMLGFISNIEIPYKGRNGKTVPVMFSGSTLEDDEGNVGGYICVAQNITELKRLEAQLKEQDA